MEEEKQRDLILYRYAMSGVTEPFDFGGKNGKPRCWPRCVSKVRALKQDEKWRLISDLRAVNTAIRSEDMSLVTPKEIAEMTKDGQSTESLPQQTSIKTTTTTMKADLRWGYHQVVVDHRSRTHLCFRWRGMIFQFRGMPFGLKDAPRAFLERTETAGRVLQKRITTFLEGALKRQGGRGCQIRVAVYIDDFIVVVREPVDEPLTLEERDKIRTEVLRILTEDLGMVLSAKKCTPLSPRTIILGLEIERGVVRVPTEKKARILKELEGTVRAEMTTALELGTTLGRLVSIETVMPMLLTRGAFFDLAQTLGTDYDEKVCAMRRPSDAAEFAWRDNAQVCLTKESRDDLRMIMERFDELDGNDPNTESRITQRDRWILSRTQAKTEQDGR